MENPGNLGKEAKNDENKEVLRGREGEVFERVIFKSSKTKKGEAIYKSSAPDRKIIVTGPFSETPEEGRPYTVLIVEDTEPDSPAKGKMIATILSEKLGVEEARERALKERADIERQKAEHILTPEDRERLTALLNTCEKHFIWKNIFYNKYDSDHERGAKATIIDLRKQLRQEGSKAVTFMLEHCRALPANSPRLANYSAMINFAASSHDSQKVIDYFSLDPIFHHKRQSFSEEMAGVLSRIGTADDARLLERYCDRAFAQYAFRPKQITAARDVVRILNEIEAKTTHPAERGKVAGAREHITARLAMTGDGSFLPSEPLGPEEITKKFEEQFIHVELADGISEFEEYWKRYNPYDRHGRDWRGAEAEIQKFRELIKKYGASDLMPRVIGDVYWTLLSGECTEGMNGIGWHDAMMQIQEETGVPIDNRAFGPNVRMAYHQVFLGNMQDFDALNFVKNLYARTNIPFAAEPEIVLAKVLDILANDSGGDPMYATEHLRALSAISGIEADFGVIEDKVQGAYEHILLTAEKYEGDGWGRRAPSLKNVALIFDITGIRPRIDPSRMQKRYASWLLENGDAVRLISVAGSLTGIEPDFAHMQKAVQERYHGLLFGVGGEDSYDNAAREIADFKTLTKIHPVFDQDQVRTLYLERVLQGHSDAIAFIQKLTGVEPDFEKGRARINDLYRELLMGLNVYEAERTLSRIQFIQEVTGIAPVLSPDEKRRMLGGVMRALKAMGLYSPMLTLADILSVPEYTSDILGEALAGSLMRNDEQLFKDVIKRMRAPHVAVNGEEVIKQIRSHLIRKPKAAVSMQKFLREEPSGDEIVFAIRKALSHDPWIAAFSRLEKIQGFAQNPDHDPWENEFKPFLTGVLDRSLISIDREEDAELVVSFIEMIGMHNLPLLFGVYADCQRHKDIDDLNSSTIGLCEDFGIKIRRQDGSKRFNSSPVLFNELSKALKGIQTELLADAIPKNLKTQLGEELVGRLKGSTQFERGDKVTDNVRAWKETRESSPSLAMLPPGFKETTLRVPMAKRNVETTDDQGAQLRSFLSSQEVADAYLPLAQAWALQRDTPSEWFEDLIGTFSNEQGALKELLSKTPEEMARMIADEPDPKQKQAYTQKAKALQNPKGRQGIERQADIFAGAIGTLTDIFRTFAASDRDEKDYAVVLESLGALDGRISLGKAIREFSVFHMCDRAMGGHWQGFVKELFEGYDDVSPTEKKIYGVQKLSKEYVEEHYLHHSQDQGHTGHTPFSPELLKKVSLAWQQQLDMQTGHLPITVLKNRLDKILGVGGDSSRKETPVTMVPVSGLLHIYSGDLGDSCHTSQHGTMARGRFPDLRSWVYVTKRGKPNEEMRGSVLAIQAEQEDGTPVLVVRANNPAENFIQTVDCDAFVLSVLHEAVETAKRARADSIKHSYRLPAQKRRYVVAIPMDHRGMASTNRQSINDVYRKRFVQCPRKGLKETAGTNFNQYAVWNEHGRTPAVAAWEIDEAGGEVWHGDWGN